MCAFLQELNDAVKAKFIEEYPEALIETNPSFFSQFTLVVATQVWSDDVGLYMLVISGTYLWMRNNLYRKLHIWELFSCYSLCGVSHPLLAFLVCGIMVLLHVP